jgi:membrane protein DedA with SNARE-associated domain
MAISLSQIAIDMISTLGYSGLAGGLFVDSFGIPIPSEILVPLATVLAQQGRFSYVWVFVIATLAQLVGGLAGYFIGRYGGEPFLEKYGKYVLISKHDLDKTHRAFARNGKWITMIGRCVPGIRGLIGYPAGIAAMDLRLFIAYTTLGSAVWTLVLMGLGLIIGNNLPAIDALAGRFSIAGIVLVLVFVIWYVRRHLKGSR